MSLYSIQGGIIMKKINFLTLVMTLLLLSINISTSAKMDNRGGKASGSPKANDSFLAIGENFVYSLSNDGTTLKQYSIGNLNLINSITVDGTARSVLVSKDTPLLIVQSGSDYSLITYDSSTLAPTGSLAFDRKTNDINDDDGNDNGDDHGNDHGGENGDDMEGQIHTISKH